LCYVHRNKLLTGAIIEILLMLLCKQALNMLLLINRLSSIQFAGLRFCILSIVYKYIKHDYIADGTCNMLELHAVFRTVISAQFVFDTHEIR